MAAGRPEVREVLARARERRKAGVATIFFLDEIHRFNKAQQDALLPAVEEGLVTLIGATTENPYFEVNSALLSRCQIYELQELGPADLEGLLRRALADPERGISSAARGDRRGSAADRRALGRRRSGRADRVGAGRRGSARGGRRQSVGVAEAEDALQRKAILYDREGDRHYDYISAWIKATRGSDPDASLYYLAAMLEGGEDPRFIARRMVILASEDVGNADPNALVVATAAARRGRPGRPSGMRAQPRPGGHLLLAGAEVERLRGRHLAGERPHPQGGRGAAARPPPRRALLRSKEARARGGLRLPARRARGRRRPAARPSERRGRALLRADRPRSRSGARQAPGRAARPAQRPQLSGAIGSGLRTPSRERV